MNPCPKCGGKGSIKSLCDDFDGTYTCANCGNKFKQTYTKVTKMANTKLTIEQKQTLAEMKEPGFFGKGVTVRVKQSGDTTIAFVPRGNTVEFSLAVMSPDEKKFRVKVGAYMALSRFHNGETVKMGLNDFCDMCDCVYAFDNNLML